MLVSLLDGNLTVIVEKYGSHFFFPFSLFLFPNEINFFLSAGSTLLLAQILSGVPTLAHLFSRDQSDARDFPRGRRVFLGFQLSNR